MKTFYEIADEIAKDKRKLSGLDQAIRVLTKKALYDLLTESASQYAKQVAEAQRQACYISADIHFDEAGMMDNYIRTDCVAIDKDSILKCKLVTDNI